MTVLVAFVVVALVVGRVLVRWVAAGPGADVSPYAVAPGTPPRRLSRRVRLVVAAVVVLLGAGAVTGWVIVRPRTFVIASGSMEPTLRVGDRVLVTKVGTIERGTVIVHSPSSPDLGWGTTGTFVHRVVALPLDTVAARDGTLYVNRRPVREPYVQLSDGQPQMDFGPVTLRADEVMVLGDHRDRSADSRYAGPVDLADVVGIVRWVVTPVDRAGRVR